MADVKKITDEQLIEKIRTEDQELYEEIVKRYETQLLRYATYLINDSEKAADAVQNAFIKAFVNLQSFDSKKQFSSWIYRIVHNETVNIIRKKSRELPLEEFKWSEKFFARYDKSEKNIQEKEMKKILQESLKELPIKYRSPLVLFYLEDKSYEEISEVLRLPIGTVGTRINRGKKYMKEIVEKKGGKTYVT